MVHVLAIDDDKGILMLIKNTLEKCDYKITTVDNPNKLKREDYLKFDLILLDVMMPDIDGFSLCKEIREMVDCPIIFLTARTMEEDIIEGLNIGGDDYITKPFKIGELRARVAAHLRREHREKQNAFSIGNLNFNLLAKEIIFQGEKLPMTKSEYAICELLAINHGQVFSKESIFEKVFGFDKESDESAITEHIKNIRSKLSKVGQAPIKTVWGVGYKWQ